MEARLFDGFDDMHAAHAEGRLGPAPLPSPASHSALELSGDQNAGSNNGAAASAIAAARKPRENRRRRILNTRSSGCAHRRVQPSRDAPGPSFAPRAGGRAADVLRPATRPNPRARGPPFHAAHARRARVRSRAAGSERDTLARGDAPRSEVQTQRRLQAHADAGEVEGGKSGALGSSSARLPAPTRAAAVGGGVVRMDEAADASSRVRGLRSRSSCSSSSSPPRAARSARPARWALMPPGQGGGGVGAEIESGRAEIEGLRVDLDERAARENAEDKRSRCAMPPRVRGEAEPTAHALLPHPAPTLTPSPLPPSPAPPHLTCRAQALTSADRFREERSCADLWRICAARWRQGRAARRLRRPEDAGGPRKRRRAAPRPWRRPPRPTMVMQEEMDMMRESFDAKLRAQEERVRREHARARSRGARRICSRASWTRDAPRLWDKRRGERRSSQLCGWLGRGRPGLDDRARRAGDLGPLRRRRESKR